jgi:hypothetical protein
MVSGRTAVRDHNIVLTISFSDKGSGRIERRGTYGKYHHTCQAIDRGWSMILWVEQIPQLLGRYTTSQPDPGYIEGPSTVFQNCVVKT